MERLEGITDSFARSLYNFENNLVFDPQAYIQRYRAVINCLDHSSFKKKIKRIVEFGCSEMKFFVHLKNHFSDRALIIDQVDIDKETLQRFVEGNVQPLLGDYVKKRANPLRVNVWCGSIKDSNENFKDIDAVIAIELIEHVYPDVFEEIPYQIFEVIAPKIAVITTPNCEFNVLFKLEEGKFRHYDHKFEFSREQFDDYCQNLCIRFPNYYVQIEGIGPSPHENTEDIGCCSQLALFIRKDAYESLEKCDNISQELLPTEYHELMHSINYPFFQDDRNRCEKILDEVKYHINRYKYQDEYLNYDTDRIEIPLTTVAKCCWEITDDEKEIERTIKDIYTIENGLIILSNEDEDDQNDAASYTSEIIIEPLNVSNQELKVIDDDW